MEVLDAIDNALGLRGSPPAPLHTGDPPEVRDELLRDELAMLEFDPPAGELAEWAWVLLDVGKEGRVRAALAAARAARECAAEQGLATHWIDEVLVLVAAWLGSPMGAADLKPLGDAWWSLVRNPPSDTDHPAGRVAFYTWWVAGYDPEGWGNAPDDPAKLARWLIDAADNRRGIIDVLGAAQVAVGPDRYQWLLDRVREAVLRWRKGVPPE